MISAIQTALSGLNAASKRIGVVAENVANLSTSGTLNGEGPKPYSTLTTTQENLPNAGGVKASVAQKSPGFVPAYAPDSPFANEQGLIGVPATDLAEEFVQMNLAKTAYRANVAVMQTASDMEDDLLAVFDKKI